nr:integrase [Pseudomonas sp. C5pp]
MRLPDPLAQVVVEGVELGGPGFPRRVTRDGRLLEVTPDGVAGHAQRLGDLPNAVPLTGQYSDLHCLLLGQHGRPRKGRDGSPGGSVLLRWGGDAAEILDYLEVVHVFIRRPYPSGQALHQTGQANRGNYSSVGLPDEELFEELARRV